MAASAHVVQLVRAHYRGDEPAFQAAAVALARASKLPRVRETILDTIRSGRNTPRPSFGNLPRSDGAVRADTGGLLQPIKPITFEELMLEADLQAAIDEIVVELEYREALSERGLRPRSRLLLHGPPGNGKTSCGSAIASALGVSAFGVHLPELMSKWVNETGENLGKLFRAIGPTTLVVFDELDAVGSTRGAVEHAAGKEANKVVNTLLTLLDRHEHGVLIATTNRPDIIDSALRRRFDEELYFPEPTVQQMRVLAERISLEHDITDPPAVDDCRNFDEVTKRCRTHARRIVMQEILAAERVEEANGNEEEQ